MIEIYNRDAREVLNMMIHAGIKVDVIVTDPPYKTTKKGSNGSMGGMMITEATKKGNVFKHNDIELREWIHKSFEVLKDGGTAYIMTNQKNLQEYINTISGAGFTFMKALIWDKGNKISSRYYMNQVEFVLFFRKGKYHKINDCGVSELIKVPNKKTKREDKSNFHDTEKPVELFKIIIESSTQVGETVFDPFFGYGASLVASEELGRSFIGAEIDEVHFDDAKLRHQEITNDKA